MVNTKRSDEETEEVKYLLKKFNEANKKYVLGIAQALVFTQKQKITQPKEDKK